MVETPWLKPKLWRHHGWDEMVETKWLTFRTMIHNGWEKVGGVEPQWIRHTGWVMVETQWYKMFEAKMVETKMIETKMVETPWLGQKMVETKNSRDKMVETQLMRHNAWYLQRRTTIGDRGIIVLYWCAVRYCNQFWPKHSSLMGRVSQPLHFTNHCNFSTMVSSIALLTIATDELPNINVISFGFTIFNTITISTLYRLVLHYHTIMFATFLGWSTVALPFYLEIPLWGENRPAWVRYGTRYVRIVTIMPQNEAGATYPYRTINTISTTNTNSTTRGMVCVP